MMGSKEYYFNLIFFSPRGPHSGCAYVQPRHPPRRGNTLPNILTHSDIHYPPSPPFPTLSRHISLPTISLSLHEIHPNPLALPTWSPPTIQENSSTQPFISLWPGNINNPFTYTPHLISHRKIPFLLPLSSPRGKYTSITPFSFKSWDTNPSPYSESSRLLNQGNIFVAIKYTLLTFKVLHIPVHTTKEKKI